MGKILFSFSKSGLKPPSQVLNVSKVYLADVVQFVTSPDAEMKKGFPKFLTADFAMSQLRQPEQVCGTRKNGASRLLNCTYILHTKLEKP